LLVKFSLVFDGYLSVSGLRALKNEMYQVKLLIVIWYLPNGNNTNMWFLLCELKHLSSIWKKKQ